MSITNKSNHHRHQFIDILFSGILACSWVKQNQNKTMNNIVKNTEKYSFLALITARCILVQSAVLRSHVVCLSVCPSVRLSVCGVGGL